MKNKPIAAAFVSGVLLFAQSGVGQPASIEATLSLREDFKPFVSLLWSPSGQAAWDALRGYHQVARIGLEPQSDLADALDDFKFDAKATLPIKSLIFGEEYTEAFANQIRASITKMIGPQAAKMIDPAPVLGPIKGEKLTREKAAIVFSAMSASPKFPGAFKQDAKPRAFVHAKGITSQVYGFGIDGPPAARMADAMTVLQDDLHGAMIVELVLFTGSDADSQRMVLARDPGIISMETGIQKVRQARSQPIAKAREIEDQGKRWLYTNTLSPVDQFWMPELHASLVCDFGELIGRTYLHEYQGTELHRYWKIQAAQQLLNFQVDHRGALVEAVFKMAPDFVSIAGNDSAHQAKKSTEASPPPLFPKRLLFNGPFMLSLWRKGAEVPYLAFWVDSPEVMRVR